MANFDPMTLFTGLMGLLALCSVGLVAMALLRRDRHAARMRTVTDYRRDLAVQNLDRLQAGQRPQPKQSKSLAEGLVQRFKLLGADKRRQLKRELAGAGWRDPSAPAQFFVATGVLPIILGLLGMLIATGPALEEKSGFVKLLIVAGAASFGFMLPRILLKNALQKRRKAIREAFPDGLDLMVICVQAGLSVEVAFNRVTREMAASAPELAEEFGLVGVELAFLPNRRMAYENMMERTGLAALKSLSTTLLQSEKYGTPIALGLSVLAQESRETRMAAAEKKAASLPAKLTVPMIVFFLPVLFAVIAGPAGIRIASGGG